MRIFLIMAGCVVGSVSNAAPPQTDLSDQQYEVMRAEIAEIGRELRNAPIEVYRNGGGTVWSIKAGDIDAWTPTNQLIWVTRDTSQNPIYKSGASKELWRIDCNAKTEGVEVYESFDRHGNLTHTWKPPEKPTMLEILKGSPVDKVRIAFCPPELE